MIQAAGNAAKEQNRIKAIIDTQPKATSIGDFMQSQEPRKAALRAAAAKTSADIQAANLRPKGTPAKNRKLLAEERRVRQQAHASAADQRKLSRVKNKRSRSILSQDTSAAGTVRRLLKGDS